MLLYFCPRRKIFITLVQAATVVIFCLEPASAKKQVTIGTSYTNKTGVMQLKKFA